MADLFEPTSIHSMTLSNRFVRSATWEGAADQEGKVTPRLIEMMVQLAKGETGLIISSFAFVSAEGKSGSRQLAAHEDRFVPGLRDMVDAVHQAGGKIALQLAHGGCCSLPGVTKLEAIGPSDLTGRDGNPRCREARVEEIAAVVSAFVDAALRGKSAGFDAVQIHAAHGYLLSQFLSPAFNKRSDQYGGPLENRSRALLEVIEGIRKEVGKDYPILVKLNSEDFLENGMTREEALEVAVMLERASVNAIELSGGTLDSPKKLSPVRAVKPQTEEDEGYYLEAARRYKERLGIPLILVGGIRSLSVAKDLVQRGEVDYISLSRPLVAEPGLVKRWREGNHGSAVCVSCNGCFVPAMEGRGISCIVMDALESAGRK